MFYISLLKINYDEPVVLNCTSFFGIYQLLKGKPSLKHVVVWGLLIVLIGSVSNMAEAQILMDQKKLETRKEKPQDKRKKFTRKKKANNRDTDVNVRNSKKRKRQKDKKANVRSIRPNDNVKDRQVDVRYSDQRERAKDNRNLSSPAVQEKQHSFDFKKREKLRPHRPEHNYEGFSKVKENENPSKEAASFGGNHQISTGVPNDGPAYKGDIKAPSPKKQARSHQELSEKRHQYEGNIKVKPQHIPLGPRYTGDLKIPSQQRQERGHKKTSRQRHQYEGDIKVEFDDWPKAPSYAGDMRVPTPAKQVRRFEKLSRQQHRFEGNIKVSPDQKPKAPSYAGTIKMPTLKAEERYYKSLSRERHQYEGDFRIKKSDKKDLHPSSQYMGGKMKNSKKQKERLRKKKIWLFRWFNRNSDQPDHLNEKPEKPKYDSRESEIWYE